MFAAAPGLFSTTTACPHFSASLGAMRRAVVSVEPPGGNATTSFTVLEGNCAWAAVAAATASTATSALRIHRFICVLLLVSWVSSVMEVLLSERELEREPAHLRFVDLDPEAGPLRHLRDLPLDGQRPGEIVLGDELRPVQVHGQRHAVGGKEVHRRGEADGRVHEPRADERETGI